MNPMSGFFLDEHKFSFFLLPKKALNNVISRKKNGFIKKSNSARRPGLHRVPGGPGAPAPPLAVGRPLLLHALLPRAGLGVRALGDGAHGALRRGAKAEEAQGGLADKNVFLFYLFLKKCVNSGQVDGGCLRLLLLAWTSLCI